MLADFLRHLFWSEAHGGDVVGTQRQLALGSLHELYGGAVAVRDVHHGKAGVGTQVALVVTRGESIVEDLNGVVCGGGKFSVHFGHAIDGLRSLDTEVRGRVTRGRGTERSNGAGDKEAQAVLQGQIFRWLHLLIGLGKSLRLPEGKLGVLLRQPRQNRPSAAEVGIQTRGAPAERQLPPLCDHVPYLLLSLLKVTSLRGPPQKKP
ncbi:hypothetical protein EYF80_006738 [Liparis tanakae]|uniref:Uncharacterized protein n=1 Tax=Liparis tanakae TaxID=230148 RepID=A0A4Z2IZG5_9TELE|nr:hypothetical protein EYF80_006738 [Liparis tanakae]